MSNKVKVIVMAVREAQKDLLGRVRSKMNRTFSNYSFSVEPRGDGTEFICLFVDGLEDNDQIGLLMVSNYAAGYYEGIRERKEANQ